MAEITIKFSQDDVDTIKGFGEGEQLELGSYFYGTRHGNLFELAHGNEDSWVADISISTLSADREYTLLQC